MIAHLAVDERVSGRMGPTAMGDEIVGQLPGAFASGARGLDLVREVAPHSHGQVEAKFGAREKPILQTCSQCPHELAMTALVKRGGDEARPGRAEHVNGGGAIAMALRDDPGELVDSPVPVPAQDDLVPIVGRHLLDQLQPRCALEIDFGGAPLVPAAEMGAPLLRRALKRQEIGDYSVARVDEALAKGGIGAPLRQLEVKRLAAFKAGRVERIDALERGVVQQREIGCVAKELMDLGAKVLVLRRHELVGQGAFVLAVKACEHLRRRPVRRERRKQAVMPGLGPGVDHTGEQVFQHSEPDARARMAKEPSGRRVKPG